MSSGSAIAKSQTGSQLDFERVPVVLERREDLLLLGGELRPRRADVLLHRWRLGARV